MINIYNIINEALDRGINREVFNIKDEDDYLNVKDILNDKDAEFLLKGKFKGQDFTKPYILENHKFSKEKFHDIIKNGLYYGEEKRHLVHQPLSKNPHLDKEHLDELIKFPKNESCLARNPSLHKEHVDKLVNSDNEVTRRLVTQHPLIQREHLDLLIRDKENSVRVALAYSITPKHKNYIDKLIKDPHAPVRSTLAANPNINDEHIKTLVTDSSPMVRNSLAKNHLIKKEHMDILEKDENEHVIETLKRNPTYIASKYLNVRTHVTENEHLSDEHIDTLLNDHSHRVRKNMESVLNEKNRNKYI